VVFNTEDNDPSSIFYEFNGKLDIRRAYDEIREMGNVWWRREMTDLLIVHSPQTT
jgi:hypothetical protein